ncbi:serine/threonine protein phosphatase 1 [Rhizobium sp. BK529]|uniref:metallophosphoesterase n=1 Tax=unclassified Rhizobium TaxID=2613769 RepID=UPI00104647C0|nr:MULTISPECIES: metallophosphoesterase [unclassified Rhizobium]MBB3590659.1 serine/threonine protein phosphatase 1 [Rhizobium sp. BK529]TCS05351.1 serine/threonine protein phosphatase 1 [Rhizobium sp. BK418]
MTENGSLHTFAIGDVHGRADLLREMLAGIADKVRQEGIRHRIVFLGDIMDRGPESRAAMDLVIRTLREIPVSKLIRGNHDAIPLRLLGEPDPATQATLAAHWWDLGGGETMASYGLPWGAPITPNEIRRRMDDEHLACLRAAERYVELDHHILVHAGLKPGIPLNEQDSHSLMWIRDEFLNSPESFGKVVVHGHTITASGRVEIFPNRIAIDTGAFATNILSALHIKPSGDVAVLQVAEIHPGAYQFGEGDPLYLSHDDPDRLD